MAMPIRPKIYHICHVDRLPSILASQGLFSDAKVMHHALPGTTVGMHHIKQRRLTELYLDSRPGLLVGECVPFYFCPRSVMLYLIYRRNSELTYQGGQESIVHLEADLHETVAWADANARRWAFTLSNAGSRYFEDRADLRQLNEIDWDSVQSNRWQQCKEAKQSEFLLEESFPWALVRRIGVHNERTYAQVLHSLQQQQHKPTVEVRAEWYY